MLNKRLQSPLLHFARAKIEATPKSDPEKLKIFNHCMAMSYVSKTSVNGASCARKREQNREYGGTVCRIDLRRFFTDLWRLGIDWPGFRIDSRFGESDAV